MNSEHYKRINPGLDVHESVHRDTIMEVTKKMQLNVVGLLCVLLLLVCASLFTDVYIITMCILLYLLTYSMERSPS